MKKNVKDRNLEGLTFGGSATYRICVKGGLAEHWADRLGGMRITTSEQEEHGKVTELVGPLLDQAALLGVLNVLYDLHLPILSATYLKTPATD